VPTLAEVLHTHGYDTTAFVTNYLASGSFGLARGFVTFHFYRERGDRRASVYLRSDALYAHIERWLQDQPPEPFFLYVHATDPHFPYVPLRQYARPFRPQAIDRAGGRITEAARPFHNGRERWGTRPVPLAPSDVSVLRALYDGEIRMADEYFGRLLDALSDRGLLDNTLVVLTSDHGEEFLEHRGVAHGQTLYAELVRVPLVVRLPGSARSGRHVDALAQHVDIFPTVLDVIGLPVPQGLDGLSLLAAERAPDHREAYVSLRLGGFMLDAMMDTRWTVIRDLRKPKRRRFEVYASDSDPLELLDRAPTARVRIGYTRRRLRDLSHLYAPGPRVPEKLLAPLRALGYIID
jgi:arylsulfatase A-like enzyme